MNGGIPIQKNTRGSVLNILGCGEVDCDRSLPDKASDHEKTEWRYDMIFRNLLFAAGMLASAASSAATFNYTAVNFNDDSVLSGTFGWNPVGAVDTNPSASQGDYTGVGFWTGSVTCTSCALNGTSFSFNPTNVSIYDNSDYQGNGYDEMFMASSDDPLGSYMDLVALGSDWFSSDALPSDLPALYFENVLALGNEFIPGETTIEYHLTEVSAVPVPPAIWLFGSALAGFVGWSRRRQNA
jgi:hypothetical protein